jgi:hypothetical protein
MDILRIAALNLLVIFTLSIIFFVALLFVSFSNRQEPSIAIALCLGLIPALTITSYLLSYLLKYAFAIRPGTRTLFTFLWGLPSFIIVFIIWDLKVKEGALEHIIAILMALMVAYSIYFVEKSCE